ncbi:MAG TPA: thioredoxin domain-containing protein [Blastocatellia bacterium]|nr:thioredoxin domain-containing protein [Blastocatellia bacterium]
MKRYLPFAIIALVFAGAVAAGAFMYRSTHPTPSATPALTPTPVASQVALPSPENYKGQVVIEEYGDYQCPPCGALHPDLKKLKGEYGDKVKFVFHHFPLTRIHQHAAIAAFAAVAAGQQGKFWEMHNLLYESQEVWRETDNLAPILVNFAKQLGLNLEQFEKDINDTKVKSIVLTDVQRGEAMGVTGTPTLFINGKVVESDNMTMDYLHKEINKLIQAKS